MHCRKCAVGSRAPTAHRRTLPVRRFSGNDLTRYLSPRRMGGCIIAEGYCRRAVEAQQDIGAVALAAQAIVFIP